MILNFAYDSYLDDGTPVPNGIDHTDPQVLQKFQITSAHIRNNWHSGENFLLKGGIHGTYKDLKVNVNTTKHFKKLGVPFIYPLFFLDKFHIPYINTHYFNIPDDTIADIKSSNSRIVIFYITEGNIFNDQDVDGVPTLDKIEKFVSDNELEKNQLELVHCNLILDELQNEVNFTIRPFNQFLSNLWFLDFDWHSLKPNSDEKWEEHTKRTVESRTKINRYDNKILSLNRIPRDHRIILFSQVKIDPVLSENVSISLGSESANHEKNLKQSDYLLYHWDTCYSDIVGEVIDGININRGMSYLRTHNVYKSHIIDTELRSNQAHNVNQLLHMKHPINVTTETDMEDSALFFSEKVYKPIFMCQPFLLLGNPYSLKKLREDGFKTFSDYWDESYDEETDQYKRIGMILNIMRELCEKSDKELFEMLQDMEDILKHNCMNLYYAGQRELQKIIKEYGYNQ